jgi:hypothetical protein
MTEHVVEPQKRVPVVLDVDVLVAGAGVSGVFAAIAAARYGARALLVDRFGTVGGNMGPGMIAGGGLLPGNPHRLAGYDTSVYPGICGIAREFVNRYAALGGGSLAQFSRQPSDYMASSTLASHVATEMLNESGARLLLSTLAAAPVMDGDVVRGLFVENKSGRQAALSNVVIDATGEADVARTAGAPILLPKAEHHELDPHSPTGMGLWYLVGGVDWDRYQSALAAQQPTDDDLAWGADALGERHAGAYRHLLPFLRTASEKGDLDLRGFVDLGEASVAVFVNTKGPGSAPGTIHGRIQPERVAEIDAGSGMHISALEAGIRAHLFEMARLWRECVPGFEGSCVLTVAPFLGARGGPCIEGQHVLTLDECKSAARFDDVMYLYGDGRALRHTGEQGECEWVDVPYRVMLPKRIDGLLATGRSASCIPDTLLRNRMAVKVMGEACGIAAALSATSGVAPRDLDVRCLQEALLDAGFHLGNRARLRELGLA